MAMQQIFLHKKETFRDFVVQKKLFLRTYATLKSPLSPLVRSRMHLAWPFPSLFVRANYVDESKP